MSIPSKPVVTAIAAVALITTAVVAPKIGSAHKGAHSSSGKSAAKLAAKCDRAKSQESRHVSVAANVADKLVAKFDSKADQAKQTYEEVVVPGGGEVENYDGLVATIAAKRANVLTQKAEAQAALANYDCATGTDRGLRQAVHKELHDLTKALVAYKKSVNALVEAVEEAVEALPTPEPSGSPEPSESPTV